MNPGSRAGAVSVVIPTAPGEVRVQRLLQSLEILPPGSEIIVVRPRGEPAPSFAEGRLSSGAPRIAFLEAESGRASCLNAGARAAECGYLWFLHADTVLSSGVRPALLCALERKAEGLTYFDLRFLPDGPALVKLSEWGARFRSRALGVPFGDQGFLLKRETFFLLGGFREGLPYGEDNLLVWKMKRRGMPIRSAGAWLYTSARGYRKLGWWRTAWLYQRRWIGQALASLAEEP